MQAEDAGRNKKRSRRSKPAFFVFGPAKGSQEGLLLHTTLLTRCSVLHPTSIERKSTRVQPRLKGWTIVDFRGCWGDMRAPAFGALISTQQSSVVRLSAALCGQSYIRSDLLCLLRCITRMQLQDVAI